MSDYLVRAITRSGAFRIVTAVTTEAAREAARRQAMSPAVASSFGRLLTGGALIRSTFHTRERLQFTFKHDGPSGDLFVDAWPDGMIRGYVAFPDARPTARCNDGVVGAMGVVQVARSRDQGDGSLYQSVTSMVSGNVQDELELYMYESEQLASSLHLQLTMRDDGEIGWAGGLLVQCLPEAKLEDLRRLVDRLGTLPPLSELQGPDEGAVVRAVLPDEYDFAIVAREPVAFRCNCSEVRVLSSFATLARDEIADMVTEGKVLDVSCGYCAANYRVSPETLRPLLEAS